MKYDEKTGKRIPENRMDEIKISFEQLQRIADESHGTFDRQVEVAWLLRDIDQSLALTVDMLASLLTVIKEDEIPPLPEIGTEEADKKPMIQ